MIPRILIPMGLEPSAVGAEPGTGRRLTTGLDLRIFVPADVQPGPLETKTSIPSHVPLDVLAPTMLVPRDAPVIALERPKSPVAPPPSRLDLRVTVPPDARPAELLTGKLGYLPEMVEPDVFTTGRVSLMPRTIDEGAARWGWQSTVSSILFHSVLVALLLFQPKLFPQREPTQKEVEMAHRNLGLVYIPPPPVNAAPAPALPAPAPAPKIRIDPRVFQQVAPTEVEASPRPGGDNAPRAAQRETADSSGAPSAPSREELRPTPEPPREVAKFEPPPRPEANSGLRLEQSSPGRLLQDSIRGAARGGGGPVGMEFRDALSGGPGGGSGDGQGFAGGAVQILTPTEGVDFTYYVARMLARVRRNWYAVIPESARLGEQGWVVLDFSVLKNGNVQAGDPQLVRSGAREPLERAAVSAIRTSNPFEQLPPAFNGPQVTFRFIFLYNMKNPQ